MALKILQLKNKLDIAQRSLAELESKDAEFETRASEIEASIQEAHDVEAQQIVDEAIEKLDADKQAHDEAKASLQREIEGLEAELQEIDKPVDEGAVETVERKDTHPMETRNSQEYINAYAEYIKSGDDREVRSLITENGSGTVPVPELVYDIVKTAWEREGIMSLVKKTYLKGNLKVGFEISSTGAVVHTEGDMVNLPAEETLTLGVVNIIPA